MLSDRELKLHGGHPYIKVTDLKAGKLSMLYEEGNLRYIKSGNTELIRSVYSALRDSLWQNADRIISDEVVQINSDSFTITYKCRFVRDDIDFNSAFRIEGKSDSTIVFGFDGEAMKTFSRNRLGICVLHPVEGCSGKQCMIVHSDGSSESSTFPEQISPNQPFRDIISMSWQSHAGKCTLSFVGDIFETEDQRNWTDNSFKTYSTPLALPYPVKVEAGTRIAQSVVLKAELNSAPEDLSILLTEISVLSDEPVSVPYIGLVQSTRIKPLTDPELRVLRAIRPDHYRVDLHLFTENWKSRADQALYESSALNCRLEIALFFDDNYSDEVKILLDWIKDSEAEAYIIHLFHISHPVTPVAMAEYLAPLLRNILPDVRIGTGTNANFVQINRKKDELPDSDLTVWSVHPQEHASDNRTLVENLVSQAETVKSAAVFSGKKGLWLSPVTMQRRFNANKLFYEIPYSGPGIPPQIDSRLMSLFGACWVAGSLKHIVESEAEGVTYFETAGERGVIQGEYPSQWSNDFPAPRGMVFPAYYVFKFLMRHRNLKVIRSSSSAPLSVESLLLADGKQLFMMLINFTENQRDVIVHGCTGMFRLKELCEKTFDNAVSSYFWTCEGDERVVSSGKPFCLEPFSVTFIEGWLKQ